MYQKFIAWCSEYLIYSGAFVVIIFFLQQTTLYGMLLKVCTMFCTVVLLWYIGALLKFIIRKERPNKDKRTVVLRDRYSFPSMHALTISAASTYVYMYNTILGIVMYCIALIIMYTRVRAHMHYMVDMVAGFCIGIIFAYIFSPLFEKYISLFLLS
jgi:membrane-associated phospholipid phosphatase